MRAELERSKSQLKLETVRAPYYIEYRVNDTDDFSAEAAFGALRTRARSHFRFVRVVVRIGDYKQDSFFGQGQGVVQPLPVDDEIVALRHQLWLATDQAYKAAAEALTAKQAQLKQYTLDEPADDFARTEPLEWLRPSVTLDSDSETWTNRLEGASAAYRTDAQLESFAAALHFQALTRYFMNSEGTVMRDGQRLYDMQISASTQASDGMRLDRSWIYAAADTKALPTEKELLNRAANMVKTLGQLRDAPEVEEDYRGPVLFSGNASASIVADLIAPNLLGVKPDLGQPGRTKGAWATSYKSRVLPAFLSVVDDPTLTALANEPLLGHYEVDDEGVKSARVELVAEGKLVNYLTGRQPIRDFPQSNGHGRARGPAYPTASLGNLFVRSSEPLANDELKKRFVELCKQRELPYCYSVEALGPRLAPRLLYRVWVKDGHEELVRGAVFGDLDVRALRNDLIALGNDLNVDNRPQFVPHSIVSPSMLFDELEIKRANVSKDKLPEYPPPALKAAN